MGSGSIDTRLALVSLLALAALALASPAPALASAPTIESESVSHVTATDATLEAQINPGGLETTYQFTLESGCGVEPPPPGHATCLVIATYPLPSGTISPAAAVQTVSLDLGQAGATLHPDTEYRYGVEATNSDGAENGPPRTFTTLPATPPASGPPSIESESLSHLTPADATLEAQINTEGLETTYEFELETVGCSSHGVGCELAPSPVSLPSGKLLGSFVGQKVSLDLNSAGVTLGKGEWFYTVTATNAAGTATGTFRQFEAPSAGPPSIDSESATNITEHDATLNAQINTSGAAVAYFFEIDTIRSDNFTHPNCPFGPCDSITVGPPLPPGLVESLLEEIQPLTSDQSVSLDLASIGATLQPGTTYYYRVIAHDALSYGYPPVYGPEQSFTTPSPDAVLGHEQKSTAIQPSAIEPILHHKKHKRRRHHAKLHRAKRAGIA